MKHSDLVNDIANIDNLMLAWCKLEGELSQQDDWCDVMEFYAYKFQLRERLEALHKRLIDGSYRMQPLRPLPFPKGATVNEENKELNIRQFFHVAVEDQLVWIAYCNVIAQFAEHRMVGWSFGNRTDVRLWYREKDGKRELQVGNYRNTRSRIYKKWEHSWPRYRKLVSLTIKLMSMKEGEIQKGIELNDEERQMLLDDESFPEQKLNYLERGYFDNLDGKELYWAGIDIERFYPSIRRELIKENLAKVVFEERQTPEFKRLTETLLDFRIDTTGFQPEELESMGINESGSFSIGLPTGLLVSGFLSNLSLLSIDEEVKKWLDVNRNVAHFRYVDDHVILSQDKKALLDWIKNYEDLLRKNGFSINKDKTEPESLRKYLNEGKNVSAIEGLDPKYPSPLMTVTLQKVSQMADMNVEQLSRTEFDILFADLKELLIMEISEQEIKKETRISFAVTMLSRIIVHGDVDYEELGRLKQELRKELENNELLKSDTWLEWFYRDDVFPSLPALNKKLEKTGLKDRMEVKRQAINRLLQEAKTNRERKHYHIYNLIVRALEEVPEKTRIWIRLLQYCYMHMPDYVSRVFELLKDPVICDRLHPLCIQYLRMMLLDKLTRLIMRDLPRNDYDQRYIAALRQLKNILDSLVEEELETYYEKETIVFVNHVILLYQIVNQHTRESIKPRDLYFGECVDIDFWFLYYLQFTKFNDVERRNEIIEVMLPSMIFDSPFFPSLFIRCMNSPDFQSMVLKDSSLDVVLIQYIKRHHLEIDVYRSFAKEYRSMIASFLDIEAVEKEKDNYISLSDWIFGLKEHSETPILHTEHLEYVALKVTRSIIKTMEACYGDIFTFTDCHINLFNLCIKKECLSRISNYDYWDEEDELIQYESTVYQISNYPFDYSLFPNEYYSVYDIGVILLQMLTLDHLPSDYMADAEYGYKWERILKGLMQQGYMSFYTYMILMACLSKRNRETILLRRRVDADVRSDDELDPPLIYDLEGLLEHVERSIWLLKENRVSLPNHKYRALSVVSLDSYRQFVDRIKDGKNVHAGELKEYLKVDIIQTNLDARQAWSGLKSKGYVITESEMKKCWSEIVMFFKQIMDMDTESRPQLVVLPEFAFDKDYYAQMKKLSDKSGCLVIAGRNFVEVSGKKLMNKAAVFVPYRWPNGHGYTSMPDFEFGKYFFADIEEKFIKKIGYTPLPFDKMYLIDSGRYGMMGLAICADFYDIERFTVYRGRIQHLFILAHNKDIKSFYYLAEAISRIVFCNVVICNTGFYGGSIAFAPYKEDYKRYVYKHEGGKLYTNQIVLLPVSGLYEAQNNCDKGLFKSRPPGYHYRGLSFHDTDIIT